MENIKIVVEDAFVGQRVDKILVMKLPDVSRTQIQTYTKEGYVKINGEQTRSNYKVKKGDVIILENVPLKNMDIEPEDIPLDIVYEDEDVIVVNKKSGMIVHPSAGIYSGTLVNALLYHCKDLSGINGIQRPGIVHRIDKETSGLLIVAKNDKAHKALSEQLQEHSVLRCYYALVHGVIPHSVGRVEAPIGRNPDDRKKMMCTNKNAKDATTNFKVIERFKDMTLIECRLETGRTHQIRVHMQYIGYPIYGDPIYGMRKDDFSHGQYLHAKELGFVHPGTQEKMFFESDLPDFFKDKLEELRKEMEE